MHERLVVAEPGREARHVTRAGRFERDVGLDSVD